MAVAKLLRAGPMQRLSVLFLCLMLALSLGFGSVAHAAEGAGVEVSTATSIGHADGDGDGDQMPADSQKGYPHHHGGCHGHDIGVPMAPDPVASAAGLRVTPSTWNNGPMAMAPSDPALRPPQA